MPEIREKERVATQIVIVRVISPGGSFRSWFADYSKPEHRKRIATDALDSLSVVGGKIETERLSDDIDLEWAFSLEASRTLCYRCDRINDPKPQSLSFVKTLDML